MSAAKRRRWGAWLRWPIALGIIACLIVPNLESLRELVAAGVLWRWLIAAMLLRLTALALASVRWSLLLAGQEIHLPWSRIVRMQCTGYVCNFLMPGTWGGDIARAGLIVVDTPDRRMRGAATVPLDRGLGLLAFIFVGAIAGLARSPMIPPGLPRLAVLALGVLAGVGVSLLGGMLWLPAPRRLWMALNAKKKGEVDGTAIPTKESENQAVTRRQRMLSELLFGLRLLRKSRVSVVIAFLLAIFAHMCLCLSLYCCLPAFPAADVPVTVGDHFWLVPAAEVPAAMLPVPGGVGAREGTLALLYGSLTTDQSLSARYAEIGVVVAATFSSVCLVLAALIGLGLAASGLWPGRNP